MLWGAEGVLEGWLLQHHPPDGATTLCCQCQTPRPPMLTLCLPG